MFYVAVHKNSTGDINARLSLATTKNISDVNGWTRYGDLFPQLPYWKTCSGALLLRDDAHSDTHYLIFGDTGGYNPATPGTPLS